MLTANPALLSEINRTIKGRFQDQLGRTATFWQEIAMRETSTTLQTIYAFTGAIGTLREWIGNRVAEEFKAYDFAIKNKHFEKTLRLNRDQVEDDQFGFVGNEAAMLGEAAARHPDILVTALLTGGFTNLGYDGAAFFSTAHPGPSGNMSNKGTTALDATSYGVARAAMRALKDDGGEILDINPDLLIVPPQLENAAKLIVGPTAPGATAFNPNAGTARVLVINRLADANDWFLMDSSKVIKPFIMQFRKDPQIISDTSADAESVKARNEFRWMVDYRGQAGYSLWQFAYGANVA